MYTALIVFVLISIIVSFLCSLWEAVLLSISPSYMQIMLNEGTKIGKTLQQFKENVDRPLAAILTLNTIAHTVGAIGVGREATKIWAETNPFVTGILVPVLMTAGVLIFSEIIPKTIGATAWKRLAPFTVRSLKIVMIALAPIIWLCQLITKLFNANKNESVFSRPDFLAMAQIGSQEGHLNELESELIHNLLNFKSIKVKEIMTPRTVVMSAPQNMTFQQFYDKYSDLVFSRIPLRESNESEIVIGYILKDDLLANIVDGRRDDKLSEIMRNIIVIPESYSILKLFNELVAKREHIALVVDNYGGTLGVVTMEDILETLLGAEIMDETDKIIDMRVHAKKRSKYVFDDPNPKNINKTE